MSLIRPGAGILRAAVLAGFAGWVLMGGAAHAEQTRPPPPGQESQTVTLPQALAMAQSAMSLGRPDITATVTQQIVSVYPQDVAARLMLSAAQTRMGQPQAAAGQARLAYKMADTRPERFDAAFLTAAALAQAGHPLRAKLWLRRSQNHSPDQVARNVVAEAYRTVSAQSPWQFGLTVAGGPSSNVNGGSLHDSFTFVGIAIPITQALPGYALGGSARVSYRLPGALAHEISLTGSHRSVRLSTAAKVLDPTARASDYTFNEVGLGYALQKPLAKGRAAVSMAGQIGRRWQGGQVLGNVQRLDLGVLGQVGQRRVAGLSLNIEAAQYPAKPTADAVQWTLSASMAQTGKTAGRVTHKVGYREVASDAAGVAYRGMTASTEWQTPDWVEGVRFSLSAGVESRDYWKAPTPNPDLRLRASITTSLDRLQRFGVVPEVTVSASRSRSDIVVRDTRDLGISFGFSSSF